jgi:hypothetical protein
VLIPFAKTAAADSPPEAQLLLCCARTSVDAEWVERIKGLVQRDIDWPSVIRTAHDHGIMPLLYRSLQATCPNAVPKSAMDQLHVQFRANARRNVILTRKLLKLLHVLRAHGIPTIPFKGPILAESVYHNLALRQFLDLDLLVHTRDFLRTQNVLISQGYQLKTEYGWQSSFVDDTNRVAVDLHQAIAPRGFPVFLDLECLWERLEPVFISGTTILSFSPADTLIVLCIQVARDEWNGGRTILSKICDIAELLRVYQGLDWEWMLKEARRLRCQRMFFFGLGLTSALLGTILPKEVAQRIISHPSISSLTVHACQRLCHRADDRSLELLTNYRFEVWRRLQDRGFPYYVRWAALILVPNGRDRALLSLPGFLSFLYYIIRPLRLVRKYGLGPFCRLLKQGFMS